jgi:catechol 2,3-dioxygenase-like lactoylglutathione lyase family enzyme
MFRQVVAYRWRDGLEERRKQGFRDALASLRNIPELQQLTFGDDAGHFDGNHDFVAVLDFADFDAARRYVANERHQTFVRDHAQHAHRERVVVQHDWSCGQVSAVHHVKIPVSDVIVSRDWYCRAFELEVTQEFHEDDRLAGVGLAHPITGAGIALRQDPARAAALAGFDAVALTLGTAHDLDIVLTRLRELGITVGPTLRGRVGLAVDVPDPDGIHVRLFTLATDSPVSTPPPG